MTKIFGAVLMLVGTGILIIVQIRCLNDKQRKEYLYWLISAWAIIVGAFCVNTLLP